MTDVVVIGGGIVGAACAYYLSLAGMRVQVVERDFTASGTSRACDGLILQLDKASADELALAKASAALWSELTQAIDDDFEYRCPGALMLAETAEGLAACQRSAADLGAAGVRWELVAGRALAGLEPELAPDLAGAIYYPDEAQVDPRLATQAMLDAAVHRGARCLPGVEATGLRRDAGGRVCAVITPSGDLPADAVVCAAGVWSNAIVRSIGLDLPVRPRKGHVLVTARVPGLIRHPMLEGSYTASVQSAAETREVALVAEMTGGDTLLLGSSREFAGLDRSVSTDVMQAIAARALRFLPRLAGISIIRSYAGLRPWSPDHLPLIGPVAQAPGLYLATGHEGAGIGLAPVTGRIIAQYIVDGKASSLADTVRPGRFDLLNVKEG